MAIRISFEDESGAVHPQAYARVENVQILPTMRTVEVGVAIFHDSAACRANKHSVCREGRSVRNYTQSITEAVQPPGTTDPKDLQLVTRTVDHPDFDTFFADTVLKLAGNSPLSQAYAYLKTLPRYVGGTDV